MLPWASIFTTPFGVLICCALPSVKGTPLIAVMVTGLPSASLSFANGLSATGVLNAVLYVSSLATGGVFGVGANGDKGVQLPPPKPCSNGLITEDNIGYSIPKGGILSNTRFSINGFIPSATDVSPTRVS